MLNVKAIAAMAVCGLLGAGMVSAAAEAASSTTGTTGASATTGTEKCYGVAVTGQGTMDAAGKEYLELPAGTCKKIVGGSTEAK